MQPMGIPFVSFSCSPMKSLCPHCPQMMSSHSVPREIQLSWEAGAGKAGLSAQEGAWHWQVWHTPGWYTTFVGNCEIKKPVQICSGWWAQSKSGHLGASSASRMVQVGFECMFVYSFLMLMEGKGFPLIFGRIFSSRFNSMWRRSDSTSLPD